MKQNSIVLLAGGVGGAKLAAGMAAILPPDRLTIIGNTGDDFTHLGLTICPDLDTIMYTLAGENNIETGWGRKGETWRTIGEVKRLGGPDWFALGDLDLGIHLTRTHLLAQGKTLTESVAHLCRHFNIQHPLLPMSDDPAATQINTADGLLPFQEWFVHQQWQPEVKGIKMPANAKATPAVVNALQNADVVIIAPSNPFVSIDPILNVYPIRALVEEMPAIVVAVSPIIGGKAVKGPAAKMMAEMGLPVTAAGIAGYYGDLIDLFVYDVEDAGTVPPSTRHHLCTQTFMQNQADKERLAREILVKIRGMVDGNL